MNQGRVMEYDSPSALLKNPDGHFTKIIDATGPAMADKLRKVMWRVSSADQ